VVILGLTHCVLRDAGTMRTVARQVARLARFGLVLGIVMTSAISQQLYLDTGGDAEAAVGAEDGKEVFNGPTYSVIVVASNPRPSNQFRDEQRVRYFNRVSGGRDVVSVKFGDPAPDNPPGTIEPPFGVRHPDGVDKRVRLIFRPDVGRQRPSNAQVRIFCCWQEQDELPSQKDK